MEHAHNHTIIFVVYDGIENSVFQSQVLIPLQKRLRECSQITVTLISFEQKKYSHVELIKIIPEQDRLRVVLFKRLPFIMPGSLLLAAREFSSICCSEPVSGARPYLIIVRGPIAGLIVQRVVKRFTYCHSELDSGSSQKPELIIQSRGLCAEEYRYAHEQAYWFVRPWHWLRYQQFKCLEKKVYGRNTCHPELACPPKPWRRLDSGSRLSFTIEAVSPALKKYLVSMFNANPEQISIASYDIPTPISPEQVSRWRQQARQELGIPEDAYVYCYSGSHKPWQCASESIAYVAQRYYEDNKSFLLVLSQDSEKFLIELKASKISETWYRVLPVPPSKLFYYLAAADAGLLFRKADVVNWVSRPTKMLEYQAVGLKVIHNGTIGLLL